MNGDFKLKELIQGLIDLLCSDIARAIFVLVIICIGYTWLYLGRLPKAWAIAAIGGIGLIFSASYIAQKLGIGG